MEMLQKEKDRDDERRERAKVRRAQAVMMDMFIMAMVGRSFSAEDFTSKKLKRSRLNNKSDLHCSKKIKMQ
jgi:hypothetical protein